MADRSRSRSPSGSRSPSRSRSGSLSGSRSPSGSRSGSPSRSSSNKNHFITKSDIKNKLKHKPPRTTTDVIDAGKFKKGPEIITNKLNSKYTIAHPNETPLSIIITNLNNPRFEWVDSKHDTIKITKSDGTQIELKVNDCFIATYEHGVPILYRVEKLGNRLSPKLPTQIFFIKWNIIKQRDASQIYTMESGNEFDRFIINSIDKVDCSLDKKGGRRMRLKSRKNSSKKNRRITRRR